jgi:hypothetical protein
MTRAVQEQRGFVDKFIGDAVFAAFPQATDGVSAAISMQQETDHMNVELVANKHTDLVRIGVGVHHGVVIAGVFGDSSRLSVTMVAPDVNLAQTLEGLTKTYGARILMSRAVIDQIHAERYEIRRVAVPEPPALVVQSPSGGAAAEREVASPTAGGGATTTMVMTLHSQLELFELFQADDPNVKRYKLETLHEFEAAVLLAVSPSMSERAQAAVVLMQLQTKATQHRLVDLAVAVLLKDIQRRDERDIVQRRSMNRSSTPPSQIPQGEPGEASLESPAALVAAAAKS